MVLALDLTIVAASDAYLRATMTERAGIIGQGFFEVFPALASDITATGVPSLRASIERVVRTGKPDAMDVQRCDLGRRQITPGGGDERDWSRSNTPVFGADGCVTHVVHRVEDVTEFMRLKHLGDEQQRATDALRMRAGQMEAEVGQRALEVQGANAKLRLLHHELGLRVEELRKSEEQLRQAQKLESIGRLAGGIAHDFNNLLSIILTYSDLVLADLLADDPAAVDLGEIRKAGERAAALTRQLLAFSRQQVLDPKVISLNDVVSGIDRMLRRLIGEDIEVATLLPDGLGSIRADPNQLEQVLMNLVVNARDAMPTGGKLTIETANVELGDEHAREHSGVLPGPYVMLAVSDTGSGMDKVTVAQIFEPFFTTKEVGKGTGLGLSMVFGIVKQSGGHVWVYSEVDQGTTFKIFLPQTNEVPTPASAKQVGSLLGTETILLAEDDEQVRNLLLAVLRRLGYRVLAAKNAAEALALSEAHPEGFNLLLTDVVMPKMSGTELAKRLSAKHPELKVVYMSGYTDEAVFQHGLIDAGVSFLQKPITPELLGRRLREVLTRPA